MSQILSIAQLGHPILRKRAVEVDEIQSLNIQQLIDDMLHTVTIAKGVGLAAPQVFESKRIIILASQPNSRYPYAPEMKPTAMINPEVTSMGLERELDWEGCLTIPGLRGRVPRATEILVRYSSRDGRLVEEAFQGFIARVFQHELDHLDGLVFLDRMESTQTLMMEQEWQKLIAQSQVE